MSCAVDMKQSDSVISKTAEFYHEESPEPPGEDVEQSLNRKLDIHILPYLFFLFFFSFMDRASIGNASIAGIKQDLHLQGNDYNIGLALFFVVYMIVDIPATWIFKWVGPRNFLSLSIFCFGITTIGLGFTRTAAQLYATRCLLGFFEGGLTPCLLVYLSFFYRRFDIQQRISGFYVAAPLSSAFGGLLASGLGKISVGRYRKWPWIFFVEGSVTLLFGVICYLRLPNLPSQCTFLSDQQLRALKIRAGDDGTAANQNLEQEKFSWRKVRQGILDWNALVISAASIGAYCNVYSYALFSPTILARFGFDVLHSQLLSVPPYILAVGVILIVAKTSDKLRMRGPFVLGCCLVQSTGWILEITCKTVAVRYFGLFLIAAGSFGMVPPLSSWLANNVHPHYARATATSFYIATGNGGGLIATFTFLDPSEARTSNFIQLGMSIWVALCTGFLIWKNQNENRLRARGGRDYRLQNNRIPEHELGSNHPSYVLSL